ncbi:MAG TPA: amidohydrolase family protein [Bryobacteraceae bacterium]|jgi:imidazolonepropionase-like amidohydrolase
MRPILLLLLAGTLPAQTITVRAGTMLDGKGGVQKNVRLTIQGSKIVRVEAGAGGPVSYDLSTLTVMPGWIDTHVHVNGHFNRQGRADTRNESPAEFALRTQGTAWQTLQGGFTTEQSIGADTDKVLRDLINEGAVLGPRILTSLSTFNEHSGTPEEIRAKVRKHKEDGADLIKIFATASSRDGGKQTMSDAQIEAACSEAKAVGLRAAVHAHAAGGAKPAVLSGCTSIEHGTFLTDEILDLMVKRGVYLDTNLSNVANYLEHKQAFLGLGNYTEEGMAEMAKDVPIRIETLRRALAKGVKVVLGTDAVAGLPGFNREEFILRVRDGHQPAMDAIVSATSRAAESLGLAGQVGSIAPGMEADLVATAGNPIDDITNVRNVAFVMKAGKVYKNVAH